MTQIDNKVTEEWTDLVDYSNYDAIPTEQVDQLRKQKHVNIRSFFGDASTVSIASRDVYMLFMDSLSMDDLSGIAMSALDSRVTVREGEQWTGGTWARDATRKHWNTLTVSCVANVPTETVSILVD